MSQPIYFKGKVYYKEKDLFIENNENPDLTYDNYLKRITTPMKNGFYMKREVALEKALKRKPTPVVYNKKKYRSLRQLYLSTPIEDKDTDISISRFVNRVKELKQNNQKNRTDDEIIFIALNAKRRQSLNLKMIDYKINKALRNGASIEDVKELHI